MADKKVTVTVVMNVVDGEVQNIDQLLEDIKNKALNVDVAVDDSELLNAQDEEDALNDSAGFDVDVDDSDLLAAKDKEESLNGSANFKVAVDGLENLGKAEGVEAISSGINQAKQGVGELYGGFQDTLDVAGQMEQNKAFLKMNLDAEEASKSLDMINKTAAKMPGDDNTMRSILSSAQALGANLDRSQMEDATSAMADYMAGSKKMGKMATETQQDLTKYLLDGNTAELERGSILSSYVDKLKEGNTFQERAKLLDEALADAKYKGIASQDTLLNSQEKYEGMLFNAKQAIGDMFLGGTKGAQDFIVKLDDITGGLAGIGLAGIMEFGPGIASIGQGIFTALPGIMMMSDKFGGLSGILSAGSGAVSGFGSALLSVATGPVGIIIAAIVALGIAIYEIGKYFGWWTDVSSMFDALKTGALALWDAFMSNEYVIQAIDLIKQGLTDAWNAISGFGQAIMSALGGGAGEFDILGFMIQNLQMILNAVGPYVILAIQGIIQVFRNLYTLAVTAWPYISQAVSTAMSIIGGVVNTGKAIFSGLMSVWNQCSSTVQSMANTISGALSAAGSAWNGFKDAVMKTIQPIIDGAKQVSDAVSGAMDWITGGGGIGTPTINTGGYSGAGYGTPVTQGNTFIFNMYGDIKDEKTLDDTINAIDSRLKFESLSNGVSNNGDGTGAI